jgi:hypothetical protein
VIAGRVKSREEVERYLRERGLQPTNSQTATGRYWTVGGRNVQIPDADDAGQYPDFILKDLMDRLKQMGIIKASH